ncbi:hypothetical protein GmHk_12G035649 [Glycine max]|uniref:Uncharacterized protein n=1 Tax=Glycine max TaxID=3847 RepID=A0A0R0H7Q9_SOYBN|nr:hypothetical protein GYH30_034319 [Glycine max]KAH1222516.1 hypothetical protein GmHk_12G035649 [Glycine max]
MSMVDENFRLTAISEDDVSSHQSDNGVYIDDVGGMNNQRQIFGLSSEAVKFRPSSCTDGISRSEFEQLRALILKEQLKTLQEESRLVRERWRQFMESFSLSPPFGPVRHSDQDDEQDDNESDDDFNGDV